MNEPENSAFAVIAAYDNHTPPHSVRKLLRGAAKLRVAIGSRYLNGFSVREEKPV